MQSDLPHDHSINQTYIVRALADLDSPEAPYLIRLWWRTLRLALLGLQPSGAGWLNDAVKGFLPGPDPDAQRFYDSRSLTVDVASPRYLLAMKLFSSRVESDADDIMLLYRQVGFTTVEEGLDLVESVYQGRTIDAKVQFLLTEIVEQLHRQDLA